MSSGTAVHQRIEHRVIGIDRQRDLGQPGGASMASSRAVSSDTFRGDFAKKTRPM
jgi:hypothetical protein